VWGEGAAVARLNDALRSLAQLGLQVPDGVNITGDFDLLASQADQQVLRAAVHANVKVDISESRLATDEAL
jgi:hypothetical protein